MHRLAEQLAAIAVAIGAASTAGHAETFRKGRVCFGKKGVTDLGALMKTVIDVLENGSTVRRIGRCRLEVPEGDESFGDLTVWDGKRRVAVLDVCGGTLLVRGLRTAPEEPLQVGDLAYSLERQNLVCVRVEGREAIRCRHEDGMYEPSMSWEIAVNVAPPVGVKATNEQLEWLLAHGRITRISRNWGCG